MAEPIKVKGIVVRAVNYGDYDKMLTILTSELGKISVSAKGVRSMKSRYRGASELLSYGEFVLSRNRGEVYSLSSAECIESFFHLRKDYLRLALGIYMADLASRLAPEEMGGVIKVLLNSLYMLQDEEKDLFLMKIICELKILKVSGFAPQVRSCVSCGKENGPFIFSAVSGGVVCQRCSGVYGNENFLTRSVEFLDYILETPLSQRLYKSVVDDKTLKEATRCVEDFIKAHVSEEIKTLEYFNKLVKM